VGPQTTSNVSAGRFFVDGIYRVGDAVELGAGDARKVRLVLRMSDGDGVEILDSAGRLFAAAVRFDGRTTCAVLEHELAAPTPTRLRVTLAQAVPKGQKMDFVIEKATELGVAAIVAFTAARTVGGASSGRVDRWRRVARTAAQQCGRGDVPPVEGPIAFEALLARAGTFGVALAPWELADRIPMRDRIPALIANARTALVVVGPEGGFAHDEARALEAAGAQLISLGSRILRTETAGLVAVAALLYAAGDL